MIPVRCFTCGKVIAHLLEEYKRRVEEGEDSGEVMTDFGLERYCCRQIFMSSVDMIKEISQFKT